MLLNQLDNDSTFLSLFLTIRGDETAAKMNMKARRLGQRERTFAKNKKAVLQYIQDGGKKRWKIRDYITLMQLSSLGSYGATLVL